MSKITPTNNLYSTDPFSGVGLIISTRNEWKRQTAARQSRKKVKWKRRILYCSLLSSEGSWSDLATLKAQVTPKVKAKKRGTEVLGDLLYEFKQRYERYTCRRSFLSLCPLAKKRRRRAGEGITFDDGCCMVGRPFLTSRHHQPINRHTLLIQASSKNYIKNDGYNERAIITTTTTCCRPGTKCWWEE